MRQASYVLSLIFLGVFVSACGVKGRPLPPLDPPTVGRGQPTFSGRQDRVSLDELNKKNESDETDPRQPKREE